MMNKLLSKFLISVFLMIGLFSFSSESVYAGGNLYLSPASKIVPQGSVFSVSVRVSSTEPINTVQANLSYPTDKVDFVSINTVGSAFDIQAENSGGGGLIKIGRGLVGVVTGDKLVASINFKAKVNSGSASITFAAGSEADNAGNVVVSATKGGKYTFTDLPTPPPPPPTDITAPQITDVKITDIGLNSAVVVWKTNEPADSLVEIGPTQKLGISVSDATPKTEHSLSLESDFLLPGATYYYQVKSKDSFGNEAVGEIASFETKGYSVKIKILNKAEKPLTGVKVGLFSTPKEATTDKAGIVEFTNVSPGNHSVHIQVGKQTFADKIDVKESLKKLKETSLC